MHLLHWVFIFPLVRGVPQQSRQPAADYSVTHLDIRDAVLSLVRVLQDQMDKLERHEGRERQLGESLTRSLNNIDKRTRNEEKMLDSVHTIVGRVEKEVGGSKATADEVRREIANLNGKLDRFSQDAVIEKLNTMETQLAAAQPPDSSPDLHSIKDLLSTILTTVSAPPTPNEELLESIYYQRKQFEIFQESILKNFNSSETHHRLEGLEKTIETNYAKLHGELKSVRNIESVLLDTGDVVLDMKRRLEYGIQQILAEFGNKLGEGFGELKGGVNERLSLIHAHLIANHTTTMTNQTTALKDEITQIWRQISILHTEINKSTIVLNDISNLTTSFISNTLSTMDGMDSNLGQVTSNINEIDENLNYLLGRISLIVQEFNMIKNGLGGALVGLKEGLSGNGTTTYVTDE